MSSRNSARWSTVIFSAIFAFTGVATALLGAALPAMLGEWHLSDRRGGGLLFCAFAGSTLGALVVIRAFRFTAVIGLLLSATGTLLLYTAHASPPRSAFFLYGLGLGATMTAISMLRSRESGPVRNRAEMNRLNLLWAVGACCAPTLALHSLRLVSVTSLLKSEAAIYILCALALLTVRESPVLTSAPQTADIRQEPFAPLRLCLFAGAAVGLESAIGSWLTTYTQRSVHGSGLAVSATSVFWLGLLLSRLLHSVHAGHWLQTRSGLLLHLGAVAIAAVLLVAPPFALTLLAAAFLAGWGLGPLYPLVLSVSLPQYRSGAVFVTAGIGSALLPWLTGDLSAAFHSLRAGMLVPCFAVLLLIAAAFWTWHEIPEPNRVRA